MNERAALRDADATASVQHPCGKSYDLEIIRDFLDQLRMELRLQLQGNIEVLETIEALTSGKLPLGLDDESTLAEPE